jgi:hypothetical protein
MTHLDCPWCTGTLELDEAFESVSCADCRVTVELAPDPRPTELDAAA